MSFSRRIPPLFQISKPDNRVKYRWKSRTGYAKDYGKNEDFQWSQSRRSRIFWKFYLGHSDIDQKSRDGFNLSNIDIVNTGVQFFFSENAHYRVSLKFADVLIFVVTLDIIPCHLLPFDMRTIFITKVIGFAF